jgi:hypothetical protein
VDAKFASGEAPDSSCCARPKYDDDVGPWCYCANTDDSSWNICAAPVPGPPAPTPPGPSPGHQCKGCVDGSHGNCIDEANQACFNKTGSNVCPPGTVPCS